MKTQNFVPFAPKRVRFARALLTTTLLATWVGSAHAQADDSPAEDPSLEPSAPRSDGAAPPAPEEASPAPDSEATATEPAAETSETSTGITGDATAAASAGAVTVDGDSAKRATAPEATALTSGPGTPLYLEVLPAQAYPSGSGGGIPGGSLRGTMGGLQWPYMPARKGDGALRVGMSGSFWVDGSRRSLETGLDTEPDRVEYRHQGRFVLRTTPVYNLPSDWFVQAQAEAVVNADQDDALEEQYVEADDLWVRTGIWNVFDVQAGRMQGWEVYHLGMGLDLNTFERRGAEGPSSTPKPLYTVSDMWDRGKSEGSVAAHVYPTDWARVEVQARFGLAGNGNFVGVRPVGILDFGFVKLKAGYEQSTTPAIDIASDSRIDSWGMGAGLDVVFDPYVELGASFGNVAREQFDADNGQSLKGSATTITYGGYINGRILDGLVLGLGYHTLQWENLNSDPATGSEPDNDTNTLMFAALQYALFDRLLIKYVFSPSEFSRHERAEGAAVPQEFTNQSISHRVRFAVTF